MRIEGHEEIDGAIAAVLVIVTLALSRRGWNRLANDGLDSRATRHPATNGSGDAADLTRDPDPEPTRVVVTAIPFVDVDTASLHAGELLHVGDYRTERVPSEGIAMRGLGMEHELAALRRRHGVAMLTLQPNS
ncbi:hypothetical protein ACVIHH_008360 [Bradyrhizobium sp. USDA 4518]